MAHRHLMAVCVVCLICAEHLPCKLHVMADTSNSNIASIGDLEKAALYEAQANNIIPLANDLYDRRKDKLKHSREKRHTDGHHHHHHDNNYHLKEEMPGVTKNFIQRLFNYYKSSNSVMNEEGFDKMISNLNLKNIFNDQQSNNKNELCIEKDSFLEKMTHSDHHEHEHSDQEGEEDHHGDVKITSENMLAICPILLYYASIPNSSCLESSNFNLSTTTVIEQSLYEMEDRTTVWLYSTLAIFLVSLCGLLGIAVIPIMDMHFYHHALQFLVALAVGTLAGDALLHLMPHAMMPLHKGQDLHHSMMYRGLAAMVAIVFFYFFERFLVMITEWRQKKEKRDKPSSRVRVMRDHETASLNGNINATCKHKYSNYPYCYDEITMETKDDHHEHQHVNNLSAEESALNHNHLFTSSTTTTTPLQNETKRINGIINENDIDNATLTLSTSIDDGSIESNALSNNNKTQSGNPVSKTTKDPEAVLEEKYTIILR